jgi:hypothetical protein
MSTNYEQISILTQEYIKLNEQFLYALHTDEPSENLALLKSKIKQLIEQIEALENKRTTDISDKDLLAQ